MTRKRLPTEELPEPQRIAHSKKGMVVTQHWAAQIEEVATGRRFVYDTGFKDNGRPPIMVSSERWHNLWPRSRIMNLQLADLSQRRAENIANRR